ncbi:substrate-binding domain-containing protein [Streptomyces sp. NPDC051322]|uniref:substrate-binding domain-containing protein n=1 Tax=Streptomyces sp. NPDC051322 TaxID=3154645 RepID=UPI0034510DFD
MSLRGEYSVHAEDRHQAILRRLQKDGALRVTDFAAELGVSPVTVRRDVESLADRGLVARVHGGAVFPERWAETAPANARPSPEARSRERRERPVGMIVPSATYYYPEVIKGAREAAAAHNIRLILDISNYRADVERTQADQMVADGVEGLLIVPSEPQGWHESLPVPTVLVERRSDFSTAGALDHVVSDHVHGARMAVRHLVEAGRQRIALLVRGTSPTAPRVVEGFEAAVRAEGLEVLRPASVFDIGNWPPESPEYDCQFKQLLDAAADRRVDAVVAHPDNEALTLLRRLRERSLSAPDDVAIVAYDDEVAALADTPLSAVAPAKHEVGVCAVELLSRRLDRPDGPRHQLFVLPQLRVRSSSST